MSAIFFLLSLAFIPFTSALVRYRIAYYPKEAPTSPSLPIDDNVENGGPTAELAPSSSDKVIADVEGSSLVVESAPSLFTVFERVRRLEGWVGFYKGILPTFLVNIFTPFFIMYNGVPRLYMSPSPLTFHRSLVTSLIHTLFYSLTLIYVYRAIATPRKLEIFGTSIKDAMRTLFTDNERRRPWVLWLTPGLLPALLLNILLRILVLRPVLNLIAGDLKRMSATEDALRMALTAVFLLLSTVVLAPLDVVVTRLAVQRNNGEPNAEAESLASEGVYDASGEQFDLEKSNSLPVPVSADREPVVEDVVVKVRGEKNPYLSLYDCAKKIVQEEGWATLYRGWWVTFLSAIVS